MASHFDAQADSSDDEAAVDLSAWKTGAKRIAPTGNGAGRATVAPMMGSGIQQEVGASASPSLSDFQNGRKRKATTPRSPAPPAFQPINDFDQESSAGEQDLEIQSISSGVPVSDQDDQEERQNGNAAREGPRKLVVRISRKREGDDRDDYEDYTTGFERVRRVLWEVRPIDRQMAYRVQFDDFHEEEVCSFLFSFTCGTTNPCLSKDSLRMVFGGEVVSL